MNKMKKSQMTACIVLVVAILISVVASVNFIKKRNFVEDIVAGPGVTRTMKMSDFNPNLKGTMGDATIYVLEGKEPGGSFLILGGTHANEPAGHMAAIVLLETAVVEKGTLYIIPSVCQSALTHNDPQEGSPQYIHFTTKSGETVTFHYGSRAANPVDQWPDPAVYVHAGSGQTLSGSETRNLNRAYPGRQDGNFMEQCAYAVWKLIVDNDITMEVDLHESSPEYPVNNATVAHQKAIEDNLASIGTLNIQMNGIKIGLESSPVNLHGLTHRELGDSTNTYALLMEVGNPSQGRLRGATNEALALTGRDPAYQTAWEISGEKIGTLLYVDYSKGEFTIEERAGRHIQGCIEYINALNEIVGEDKQIKVSGVPTYAEIMSSGATLGDWLIAP